MKYNDSVNVYNSAANISVIKKLLNDNVKKSFNPISAVTTNSICSSLELNFISINNQPKEEPRFVEESKMLLQLKWILLTNQYSLIHQYPLLKKESSEIP